MPERFGWPEAVVAARAEDHGEGRPGAAQNTHICTPWLRSARPQKRYLAQQALVDLVIGDGSLRVGCDRDHAAATFFAVVNSGCYQLLEPGSADRR